LTEVEYGCHAKSLGLEGEEVPVVREPAKIARVFPLRAKRWGSHMTKYRVPEARRSTWVQVITQNYGIKTI